MKNKSQAYQLVIGDRVISYEWTRKQVKNINLRVRADGTVHVSSPHFVSSSAIEQFLTEKAEWIVRAMERIHEKERKDTLPSLSEGSVIYLLGEMRLLRFSKDCNNEVREKDGVLTLKHTENTEKIRDLLRKYAEKRLLEVLSASLSRTLAEFSVVKTPEIRLRLMRAVWGNCRPKAGIITINSRLACYPERLIDYIVLHEVCHLFIPDHSQRFYALMTEHMPDWKKRKEALNRSNIQAFF